MQRYQVCNVANRIVNTAVVTVCTRVAVHEYTCERVFVGISNACAEWEWEDLHDCMRGCIIILSLYSNISFAAENIMLYNCFIRVKL